MTKLLIFIHFFIGFGAVAGGLAGLLNPETPFTGLSPEILQNGPFTSFFIPSLFLFIVLGLGNIIAGILAIKFPKSLFYLSVVMGGILSMFIIIQCWVMWAIVLLHVIFFVIGAFQFLAGAFPIAKEYLTNRRVKSSR